MKKRCNDLLPNYKNKIRGLIFFSRNRIYLLQNLIIIVEQKKKIQFQYNSNRINKSNK